MNNILPIYTSLQHVIGLKFLSLNEKYKFDKETKILHFYGTMSNKISYKIRLVNDALKLESVRIFPEDCWYPWCDSSTEIFTLYKNYTSVSE